MKVSKKELIDKINTLIEFVKLKEDNKCDMNISIKTDPYTYASSAKTRTIITIEIIGDDNE